MPVDSDFEAWFRLLATPGIGRGAARRLLVACGSPDGVFSARRATLQQLAGEAVADALSSEPPEHASRLAAARAWLAGGAERHAVTLDQPAFPPALLQTADPPLLLYVQGPPALLARAGVAVVGSRHPTPQGKDNALAFAQALGDAGYAVASGLARGIDGAAHEGALRAAAGTVAVVGTGLDTVYPASHRGLAQRIEAAGGAIVSEYPPGVPPLPDHFPQRNRIIAGLTLGTLVVEAALPSGSLITARLASEAGREVFAMPGSIHSPQSKGCHWLIKQGAKLVEAASDIVDELRGPAQRQLPLPQTATPATTSPRWSALLETLGFEPATLDALMARTGAGVAELSALLLELELDGRVARLPGGLYQQRHTG